MRILAVKLSALGDLFHPLPALHDLKRALGCEIDWVVQRQYVSLVECFTDIDRVIGFPRRRWARGAPAFLRALRQREYDVALDFQGLLKSGLVCRLARASRRVGPSFHREGSRVFYTDVAGTLNKARHAVEECRDFAEFFGAPPGPDRFPVAFPAPSGLDERRPRVAVAPASRWPSKNWPAERFAAVARGLAEACDPAFYLLGSPGERELCAGIAQAAGNRGEVHDMAGRLSLAEVGGLLERADLLIANDTGLMHMAAAVGTPVLALFGPTDPVRTGPYGPGHRVLTAPAPCRPCFSRTCREPGRPCLDGIDVERVVAEALDMLGR